VPCSYYLTGEFAPATVNVIQLTVTFDPEQLQYGGWSLDDFGNVTDPYWDGDAAVDDTTTVGTIRIYLDADTKPAPTSPQPFIYLRFAPHCQAEENPSPVTILTGEFDSFTMEGAQKYKTFPELCVDGALVTADYDGYLSVLDSDPYDEDPETIVLEGVVGMPTEIEVPVYMSTVADVGYIHARILFDTGRLELLDLQLETECNPWFFVGDTIPEPDDEGLTFFIANYPPVSNYNVGLCRVMTMRFAVQGDWEDDSTALSFDPAFENLVAVVHLPGSPCLPLSDAYSFHGGEVEIANYEAELSATVETMIDADDLPEPGEQTIFPFWTTIAAVHNFIIGGGDDGTADGASLRIDLDLPDGMSFLDIYQPDPAAPDTSNPLDDFYFHFIHAGKSATDLELWSEAMVGLQNFRLITPEPEPLVRVQLSQVVDGPPASFDDHAFPFGFDADNDAGRVARLLDAPTGTIAAIVADSSLTLPDGPSLDYAVGELSCDFRSSIKPASVVQYYYVRSSFELTGFTVTVNKSGAHNIVTWEPAEGVLVTGHGDDYVTFAQDPATWEAGVFEERRLLGSITYSTTYYPPDDPIDKDGDKDIGPPIRWCWTYTDITFDRASTLAAGGGYNPIMFWIENDVGTKWNCSPVVDPEPLPQPRSEDLPVAFDLRPCYPNPFNPQTTIAYDLPHDAVVQLDVVDVQGRRIRTLVTGARAAGRHEVVWDGTDETGKRVASGVYFSLMQAGDFRAMSKMILLK
jgi:hypothetical protein